MSIPWHVLRARCSDDFGPAASGRAEAAFGARGEMVAASTHALCDRGGRDVPRAGAPADSLAVYPSVAAASLLSRDLVGRFDRRFPSRHAGRLSFFVGHCLLVPAA